MEADHVKGTTDDLSISNYCVPYSGSGGPRAVRNDSGALALDRPPMPTGIPIGSPRSVVASEANPPACFRNSSFRTVIG